MFSVSKSMFAAAIAIGALTAAPAAAVAVVNIVSVSASSSFAGYDAGSAIDGSLLTDWASNSQGAGSYLNISFDAAYDLSAVSVTDRVTSGGMNGSFTGGVTDFTTQYSLTVYSDAMFATPVGTPLVFNKMVPGAPSSPADFLNVQTLGGLTAQYVRYTVLQAGSSNNPGLSNIGFEGTLSVAPGVPEPANWVLLIAGFGFIGVASRRRRLAVAA